MDRYQLLYRKFLVLLLLGVSALAAACAPTSNSNAEPELAQSETEQPVEEALDDDEVHTDDGGLISAFAGLAKNSQGYIDLPIERLATALDEKTFTLVNVHIPFAGDLPETDLSIPFTDLQQFEAELPDKDAHIVIYCQSGGMSSQMAPMLAELGYSNVYELDGGFNAWASAGYELLLNQ